MRHIYIDGQAVTNDWGGNSADMILDAVKPVFRVSAKRMAFGNEQLPHVKWIKTPPNSKPTPSR